MSELDTTEDESGVSEEEIEPSGYAPEEEEEIEDESEEETKEEESEDEAQEEVKPRPTKPGKKAAKATKPAKPAKAKPVKAVGVMKTPVVKKPVRPVVTEADGIFLKQNKNAIAVAARLMKQSADPTRIKLLGLIDGVRNVGDLCILIGQSQPAVSHHIALMRTANLITPERDGKVNLYRLNPLGKALLKAVKSILAATDDDDE